jgi:hypothetical protein
VREQAGDDHHASAVLVERGESAGVRSGRRPGQARDARPRIRDDGSRRAELLGTPGGVADLVLQGHVPRAERRDGERRDGRDRPAREAPADWTARLLRPASPPSPPRGSRFVRPGSGLTGRSGSRSVGSWDVSGADTSGAASAGAVAAASFAVRGVTAVRFAGRSSLDEARAGTGGPGVSSPACGIRAELPNDAMSRFRGLIVARLGTDVGRDGVHDARSQLGTAVDRLRELGKVRHHGAHSANSAWASLHDAR